jgi:hypothetical protein
MTYASLEQRREARETVSHHGKFEGESPITPILWEMVLDSCADEEDGNSCDGPMYAARIGRWIVSESTSGFVSSSRYATVQEAESVFAYFVAGLYPVDGEDSDEEDEREPETGPCDSCALVMINGVRCHETGCPRARG